MVDSDRRCARCSSQERDHSPDIKLANIFLTARGQVKILDFGISKLMRGALGATSAVSANEGGIEPTPTADSSGETIYLTRPGLMVGTAAYMSPEQVRREELDGRTDIFSFGAVLHEMATNRLAFSGDTMSDILDAILHREPGAVSRLAAGACTEFEEIVTQALEKDRKRPIRERFELADGFEKSETASGSATASVEEQ